METDRSRIGKEESGKSGWVLLTERGELLVIPPEGATLGRGEDSLGWQLFANRCISREHLRLEPTEGQTVILRDLSRNGTYLNGKRMERFAPTPARAGARLRLVNRLLILMRTDMLAAMKKGEGKLRWKRISPQYYATRFPCLNEDFFESLDEKEAYLAEYSLYMSMLTRYLCQNTSILFFEREIRERDFRFPIKPVYPEERDLYQYLCGDALQYFYVRNNVYIERLDARERAFLRGLLLSENVEYDKEMDAFIRKTLFRLTAEMPEKRVLLNFGPGSTRSFYAPNDAIVIGARMTEGIPAAELEHPDRPFSPEESALYHQRIYYFGDRCEALEAALKEELGHETRVIEYGDTSVRALGLTETE